MRIPFTGLEIITSKRRRSLESEIRRLLQHARNGRSGSESTLTWLTKETWNMYHHLEHPPYDDHTIEIVENWARNILDSDRAKIYVYEGKDAKMTISADLRIQGSAVKRIEIFKQYPTVEEAMREELVQYPKGKDLPKRTEIRRVGRNIFEEYVLGMTAFSFLEFLETAGWKSGEKVKDTLICKLLSDQAYYNAQFYGSDLPWVNDESRRSPRTDMKLVKAIETFGPVSRKDEFVLRKIGEYLDSHAAIPFRDAWLFNQQISFPDMLDMLEYTSAAEEYRQGMISEDEVLKMFSSVPADTICDMIENAVYQHDFESVHYDATEERDRLQILSNPFTNFSVFDSYEKFYRERYNDFGGKPVAFMQCKYPAMFNHHVRCAYTFNLKRLVPYWIRYQAVHLEMAHQSVDGIDILNSQEKDILYSLFKKLDRFSN